MKYLLKLKLKWLARMILKKQNPQVIGITGSVGKTSAKDAIFSVISKKFNARKTYANYNNELGVPLTIIGAESAGKNIFKWLIIFWQAFLLFLFEHKNYPKILVLEMAVDRPGDMDYLLSIARPDIGVLTRVGPVHLEFFGEQQKILEEKAKMIKVLPKSGFAILNYDAKDVLSLCDETRAKCITYGFEEGADLRIKSILETKSSTSFTLRFGQQEEQIVLLNVIGKAQAYATLCAIACGIALGMELSEIKESIKDYRAPQGRGNLLKGVKNTYIIDDTYNASPQSVEMALETLKTVALGGRTIAVLGDMLELGPISNDAHLEIGKAVAELRVDYLFTVGPRGKIIARGAEAVGMKKDRIFSFEENSALGNFLQDKMEEGSVILIKGSRGMKMEEIVEEIKKIDI